MGVCSSRGANYEDTIIKKDKTIFIKVRNGEEYRLEIYRSSEEATLYFKGKGRDIETRRFDLKALFPEAGIDVVL